MNRCPGCGLPVQNKALHSCSNKLELLRLKDLVSLLRAENAKLLAEREKLLKDLSTKAVEILQANRVRVRSVVSDLETASRDQLLDEVDRLRGIIYATPR